MDNTSWLESWHIIAAMKVLFETKLQHQGYESYQYSIYYESRRFENKCFSISTHKYEPLNSSSIKPFKHIICHVFCMIQEPYMITYFVQIQFLKKSELMNIDNLNYTYANVMQQPDQSSCGSFAIAYVIDIVFNINVKKSKYAISKMRRH